MAILVDPLQPTPAGPRCHMVSTVSYLELRRFALVVEVRGRNHYPADRIPHYDLTPAQRTQAVKAGAREVTFEELLWRAYRPAPLRDTSDRPSRLEADRED